MKAIITGGLMALAITTAYAAEGDNPYTANYLLPYCKRFIRGQVEGPGAWITGRCLGIVEATANMFNMAKVTNATTRFYCADIPTGSPEQLVRVVTKYGDDHPEQTHQLFQLFVFTALREAWPCRP